MRGLIHMEKSCSWAIPMKASPYESLWADHKIHSIVLKVRSTMYHRDSDGLTHLTVRSEQFLSKSPLGELLRVAVSSWWVGQLGVLQEALLHGGESLSQRAVQTQTGSGQASHSHSTRGLPPSYSPHRGLLWAAKCAVVKPVAYVS